jgi:Flp pilus assembly protein TadD
MCNGTSGGLFLAMALILPPVIGGCNLNRQVPASGADYSTVAQDPRRDTSAAQALSARGAALVKEGRFSEAEAEFKAALSADVFLGPAHNNLGLVYYQQKRLYLAAWEFQYASKLMPTKAEPRNNLGMVLESVGKLDEAAKTYEEALKLEPDSVQVAGNLARTYVRSGRKDSRTREVLEAVAMKDLRPDWREWARGRLAFLGQPTTTSFQQDVNE